MVERIFLLMDERGISAAVLSKETGINTSTITQWKKGLQKPSADAIIKLAYYFSVSTDYLLGKTDDPTPPGTDTPYVSSEEHILLSRYRALPPEKRKAIETLING